MQQPVGARQTAINVKLLFQYALRVDPTKRHHPVPRQFGTRDNPFLEPHARHGVDPRLATRARPVTQSFNAVLFIAVMPFVSRRPAQPSQPAASSCSIPSSMFAIIRTRWQTRPLSRRAKRRSSAAPGSLRKKYAGISIPHTWYAFLITLPYLAITGS